MPGPCVVVVLRVGTGHTGQKLFPPWLLLLETKWDFSESSVAQTGELKAKLWEESVVSGSSFGSFTVLYFLHHHPFIPVFPFTKLSSPLCPQLCWNQFPSAHQCLENARWSPTFFLNHTSFLGSTPKASKWVPPSGSWQRWIFAPSLVCRLGGGSPKIYPVPFKGPVPYLLMAI